MARFTSVEQAIDDYAHRLLERAPESGARAVLAELLVFVLKQAWACIFGAALLAVLLVTRIWYPDDVGLTRNDFLTLAAIAIQLIMVVTRLETLRELQIIVLFHLVGTGMELFKTDVGSWSYEGHGILMLGAVPLYSGFMYAAVGSYLVRVYRLFDLRFDRYPLRRITAIVAGLIYANFFTHHYLWDARWLLLLAVVIVFGRCVMHFRIFRMRLRMPILVSFLLVALFIWIAENIATWSNAWLYPSQQDGWQLVSLTKLVSWFLLMIISVVLVAWLYRPVGINTVNARAQAQTMAKVEHFEIPADDIDRAQTFYREVFGFGYEPWADDMGMLISGGTEGINGDLHKRGALSHPTVVFTVDNIEATVAIAVPNGGEQVGEIQPLDETSRWVYIKDSEGNIIGVFDKKD